MPSQSRRPRVERLAAVGVAALALVATSCTSNAPSTGSTDGGGTGTDVPASSAAGGSGLQPAETPSGWTTYSGAGFSFAYPSGWQMSTQDKPGGPPNLILRRELAPNRFCIGSLQPQPDFLGDFLQKVESLRDMGNGVNHKTVVQKRISWPKTTQAEYYEATDDRPLPSSAASPSPGNAPVATVELSVLSKSHLAVDFAIGAPAGMAQQCDGSEIVRTLRVK